MEFRKYQHIANNVNDKEIQGLFDRDEVVLQVKLDGSNCQVYWDDGLVVTSRNRVLSPQSDNAGCYAHISKDTNIIKFLQTFPPFKLVGEWLVQHHIHYRAGSYNKFYVFDIIVLGSEDDECRAEYLPHDDVQQLCKSFGLNYVSHITVPVTDINHQVFEKYKEHGNYLLDSDVPAGEGFVVKANYKNSFGRSTWCKLINRDAFNMGNKVNKIQIADKGAEEKFIAECETLHLIIKCYNSFEGGVKNEDIGTFLRLVMSEFHEDFTSKSEQVLNVKYINNILAKEAKIYLELKRGTI